MLERCTLQWPHIRMLHVFVTDCCFALFNSVSVKSGVGWPADSKSWLLGWTGAGSSPPSVERLGDYTRTWGQRSTHSKSDRKLSKLSAGCSVVSWHLFHVFSLWRFCPRPNWVWRQGYVHLIHSFLAHEAWVRFTFDCCLHRPVKLHSHTCLSRLIYAVTTLKGF